MIILEWGPPWNFFRFRSELGGMPYRRWGIGFLAVTYWPGEQYDYNRIVSSGATEWRDK